MQLCPLPLTECLKKYPQIQQHWYQQKGLKEICHQPPPELRYSPFIWAKTSRNRGTSYTTVIKAAHSQRRNFPPPSDSHEKLGHDGGLLYSMVPLNSFYLDWRHLNYTTPVQNIYASIRKLVLHLKRIHIATYLGIKKHAHNSAKPNKVI